MQEPRALRPAAAQPSLHRRRRSLGARSCASAPGQPRAGPAGGGRRHPKDQPQPLRNPLRATLALRRNAPAQDIPETQPATPDDVQPVQIVRRPLPPWLPRACRPVAERVTEASAPVVPKATPQPKLRKRRAGGRRAGRGWGSSGPAKAVCVDRYEYPNYLRSAPQGNFNAYKAQALCAKKGKRICSEREWVAACSGKGGSSFPYGSRFVAGRCNTLEDGRDEAVAPLEYKKCRSGARILPWRQPGRVDKDLVGLCAQGR